METTFIPVDDYSQICADQGAFDESAIKRSYQRLLKRQKNEDSFDLAAFLAEETPSENEILLYEAAKGFDNARPDAVDCVRRHSRKAGFPERDTFFGFAVPVQLYEQLQEYVSSVSAIKPIFESVCTEHGIVAIPSLYPSVLSLMGTAVIKDRFHPSCDFFEFLQMSALEARELIRSAVAAAEEGTLSDGECAYISVNSAAERLKVPFKDFRAWLASHRDEYVFPGTQLLIADKIRDLKEHWQRAVTIDESFVSRICPEMTPEHAKLAVAALRQAPDLGILPDNSFPLQRKIPTAADYDAGRDVVTRLLANVPFIQVGDLVRSTGLPRKHLLSCAERGMLTLVGDKYLCYREYERALTEAQEWVPLDDVISELLAAAPSKFRLESFRDRAKLLEFCDDNNWWGVKHFPSDTTIVPCRCFKLVVPAADKQTFARLSLFLRTFGLPPKEIFREILEENKNAFPRTVELLRAHYRLTEISPAIWQMADILFFELSNLQLELLDLSKEQIKDIISDFSRLCTLTACKELTSFLAGESLLTGKTTFSPRGKVRDVSAYSIKDFALMNYVILNPEAWSFEGLIKKAIIKEEYANLWAYAMIHCFSAIRDTDVSRLEMPVLPGSIEPFLAELVAMSGHDFSPSVTEYAEKVATSFTAAISYTAMTPHKTSSTPNVAPIMFLVPRSCMMSLGVVLTILISHRKQSTSTSFIEPVHDKLLCHQFFGWRFSEACGQAAFSGHRACKAFLQSREAEELGRGEHSPYVAYTMAAMLRSHKGGYGKLPETTSIYLRDANFAGLTPEFVAEQMLERGSCSWVVDRVFEMAYGSSYKALSPRHRTKVIAEASIDAHELTSLRDAIAQAQADAIHDVEMLIPSETDARAFFDRWFSNQAVGKDFRASCARMAAGRPCPEKLRQSCMGCKYELHTAAMLGTYLTESRRLIQKSEDLSLPELERMKNESLALRTATIAEEIACHVAALENADQSLYLGLYDYLQEA